MLGSALFARIQPFSLPDLLRIFFELCSDHLETGEHSKLGTFVLEGLELGSP